MHPNLEKIQISLCPLEKSASYSRDNPQKKMHANLAVHLEKHLSQEELIKWDASQAERSEQGSGAKLPKPEMHLPPEESQK